jgi:hypothetical protein
MFEEFIALGIIIVLIIIAGSEKARSIAAMND